MKFLIAAAAALAVAAPAAAVTNLVTNGGFENTTFTTSHEFDGPGNAYGTNNVVGWASNAYTLLFIGGTQTTVNAVNRFGAANNYFYNSLSTLSPDGGNFVALDGDSSIRGPLSQTINGLTVGKSYTLAFNWGGAQLRTATGATTDQLSVTFGGQTQSTAVISNVSQGFTGWLNQSFNFTATSTSQVLSFLSIGTPDGLPPIAVLDGVSLVETPAVPEPATWALLITGFAFIGAAARRRRAAVAA